MAVIEDNLTNRFAEPWTARRLNSRAVVLASTTDRPNRDSTFVYVIDLRKGPILDYKEDTRQGSLEFSPFGHGKVVIANRPYARPGNKIDSLSTSLFVERILP